MAFKSEVWRDGTSRVLLKLNEICAEGELRTAAAPGATASSERRGEYQVYDDSEPS